MTKTVHPSGVNTFSYLANRSLNSRAFSSETRDYFPHFVLLCNVTNHDMFVISNVIEKFSKAVLSIDAFAYFKKLELSDSAVKKIEVMKCVFVLPKWYFH